MGTPESGVEQKSEPEVTEKSVEMGINLEKLTDEMQGLEVNQNPVLDVEPRREINQKPADPCQHAAVGTKGANSEEKQTTTNPGGIYRCKKCRRMVATQEYVVTHKVGSGESHFFRHKTDGKEPECTPAIFVEPMKWMEAVEEGHVSHKLWCMDCKTRLGSFDWAGMQCSCGAWVIPAFQLLRSRIDECQM
uniref:Uncharacterized protein n=1 Tax=Avena sativa TaxID=4498 RepID=A0ACD5TI26_AVESA